MSRKLDKKMMQTDELQEALVASRDYVVSHRSETLKWGAIAVGGLVLVGAIVFFVQWREGKQSARLSQALAVFNSPTLADQGGPNSAPGQKVYKDPAERQVEAKKLLDALVQDSPSSKAGRIAQLMLLSMEGDKPISGTRLDAIRALANGDRSSILAGIAAVSLLEAQASSGKAKEAIEIGKKFLESADNPVPKDVLIFTMARLYEKAGMMAEAKGFYQRVVSDFPDSPVRFEAQQKVQAL